MCAVGTATFSPSDLTSETVGVVVPTVEGLDSMPPLGRD